MSVLESDFLAACTHAVKTTELLSNLRGNPTTSTHAHLVKSRLLNIGGSNMGVFAFCVLGLGQVV